MEVKKNNQANKTVERALSMFTDAIKQIETAIELKEASIAADNDELGRIAGEILKLEQRYDEIQAASIKKNGEIKQHKELIVKLQVFAVGER